MYYLILILLLFISSLESIFQEKAFRKYFALFSLLILFILQAYNTWSPDYENYESQFDYIDSDIVKLSTEPMHIFINTTVKDFGGKFNDVVFIYGVLIFLFFSLTVIRITPLPAFLLGCYFILPFYPNIVQIRFFLAFSIFIFAVTYLKKFRLSFYIFYVFSVLTHYSMLVMLPFFIMRKFSFFGNYRKNNLIILIACIVLFVTPSTIVLPIINFVNPKYEVYLVDVSAIRFLGTILLFLPFFLINNYALWHYKNKFHLIQHKVDSPYKDKIPVLIQLIQYSNFIIIPQYFSRDMWRLSMNLTVFALVYFSICIFYGWYKVYSKQLIFISKIGIYSWLLFTFFLIFLVLNDGEYMEIIRKTVESNSILETLL